MATIPSVAAIGTSKDRFNPLFVGHAGLHLALVEQGSTRVLAAFSDTAGWATQKAPPDTLHA